MSVPVEKIALRQNNNLPKILIVDDEPRVLRSLKAAFKTKYDVSLAQDAFEAQAILKSTARIDVIVSDERMPKLSGHEFLQWAKVNSPHSVRILFTGTDINALQVTIAQADIFDCVAKPWNLQAFEEVINKAVAESRASSRKSSPAKQLNNHSQRCVLAVLDPDTAYRDLYRDAGQKLDSILDTNIYSTPTEVMQALSESAGIGVLSVDLAIGQTAVMKLVSSIQKKHPAVSILLTADPGSARNFLQSHDKSQIDHFIVKPMSASRLQPMVSNAAKEHIRSISRRNVFLRPKTT